MKNNLNANKPVFLFDGDCFFCRRWIERWRVMAGDKAEIEPYQTRSLDFPQVSVEEFQKSVFLFEENRTSRGVEAVFRLMAYNPQKRLALWLYEKSVIFKMVSEKIYAFVAAHRSVFSKITKLFWGDDLRPDSYFISRKIFFCGLALVYTSAFASLSVQITGLLGPNGISPVQVLLVSAARHVKSLAVFWHFPSIFWLGSSDFHLLAVCGAGVVLSLILFAGFAIRACLFLLWFLYLSIAAVGRDFLSFQWDVLLLETGFLSLFWSPRQKGFLKPADWHSNPVPFSRALLFLLLFKLMLSSGLVKLASGDPTWRNLTALNFHFETQPLPNPLSWFAHRMPEWLAKFSTLMMFVIEIITPFLLFFPRNLRRVAAIFLILLQIAILVTGNYCFFNFLSILLCLTALDDLFWRTKNEIVPRREAPWFWKAAVWPVAVVFLLVSSNQIARIVDFRLPWKPPAAAVENVLLPFRFLNNYGLFAVMTTERMEIIIQGSNDGKDWKNYEFKFKPGDPAKLPAWAAPHQPRLDWQMWFAALSSPDRQRWFVNFCAKLLQGSPQVLNLLAQNPFPQKPPLYVRAMAYRYRFANRDVRQKLKVWWREEELGTYLPAIALNSSDSKGIADK